MASRETTSTPAAPVQHQDPQAGGSYIRHADGSLELVSQTQPAQGRARRAEAPHVTAQPEPTKE